MIPAERKPFSWVAGRVVLDFVNTRAWFGDQPASERFRSAADVVAWGVEARILAADDARAIADAGGQPDLARRLLNQAVSLREHLHALFSAVAAEAPVSNVILKDFNTRFAAAAGGTAIAATGDPRRFSYRWGNGAADPDRLFHPLLVGAATLLTSDDARRVRACGNDRCGWLFLDTSRTGRRRWCDMAVCGNRVKSRRRYARRKAAASQD